MKASLLAAAALATSMAPARANGVMLIGYNGPCTAGSKIEATRGSSHSEKPLPCRNAMLIEIQNGRRMIGFVNTKEKQSPLFFGGPGFQSAEGRTTLPIDHVYPRHGPDVEQRPAKADDGTCFFDGGVQHPKMISCIVKMQQDDITLTYTMVLKPESSDVHNVDPNTLKEIR